MSQTTLTVSASTWLREGDSVNHSSATDLKTAMYYSGQSNYAAVLQFTVTNAYRYKKITRAMLKFYTRGTGTYVGVKVAPYVAGTVLSTLTGSYIDANGDLGDLVVVENSSSYGGSYPKWRSVDVTSLFTSNLYNNTYFTIFVFAFPGIPSDGGTATIDGVGGTNPAQLILDYEDVEQLPPTPSYPNGAYINENTDLLFAWSWNSSTQAVQASVQLEYKLASAQSYTVLSLTQTGHTYTLAGGLPQGAYVWRIKGTNDAGETSAYSSLAEFTVIGKPAAPVINTPTNKTLTEITWQASDQNSYDIVLTDSNGVELINEFVASSASSYKPNMFLKGTYTVGIRYRNSSGLSSDWTYKTFAITASGPAKPTMVLYGDAERARVVITMASGIQYALMRAEDPNGVFEVVGLFESETFIDKTLKFNTSYIYKVRAYASAGYTDSDPERFRVESGKISLHTEDFELFLSKSEEEFLPYTEDSASDMAAFRCPGRIYPVVEHSEVESWTFQTALHTTEAQKETLRLISKDDYIFYRDYSGRAFPVAIQRLSFTRFMNDGYIANIEFIRIAEREVVVNV